MTEDFEVHTSGTYHVLTEHQVRIQQLENLIRSLAKGLRHDFPALADILEEVLDD